MTQIILRRLDVNFFLLDKDRYLVVRQVVDSFDYMVNIYTVHRIIDKSWTIPERPFAGISFLELNEIPVEIIRIDNNSLLTVSQIHENCTDFPEIKTAEPTAFGFKLGGALWKAWRSNEGRDLDFNLNYIINQ